MHNLIKKHQKKLFAFFAVFLMIAFAASYGGGGGRTASQIVVGTISTGDKVYAEQLQIAEQEWHALSRQRWISPQFGPLPYPIVVMLGWNETTAMQLMQHQTTMPVAAIERTPRLFFLLTQEAKRMGVTVSSDQVQDVLTNQLGQAPTNPDERAFLEQSIRDLLLADAAYRRAESVIKISNPMRQFALSRQQSITVNVVSFDAADFAAQVPAPTTQQLEQQFTGYANNAKGDRGDASASPAQPTTNPFGFGYKFRDRVKLQYIAIPHDEVRKLVETSKDADPKKNEYYWEVAAQKYYQQHQSEFPTTRPSSELSLTAVTQPTTKPFAEVREEAKNRVLVPEVEKKINEIQSLIVSTINTDYQSFMKSSSGGATTQAGASSLGVPYTTYDYLNALATRIQQQTKVLPKVASLTEKWRGVEELQALAGIGASTNGDGLGFAQYIQANAETFLTKKQRESSSSLRIWEPSQAFHDDASENVYLFRLTAAESSHAPASLDEVRDEVSKDFVAKAQLDRAREAATKVLDAAKASNFDDAAKQANKSVLTIGPFDDRSQNIAGLTLPPESRGMFMEHAYELLATPAAKPGAKPIMMFDLPEAGKVMVAQLGNVTAGWSVADAATEAATIDSQLRMPLQNTFEAQWFNYEDARKRTSFVSDLDRADTAADAT